MIKANVKLCLKGDDSGWRALAMRMRSHESFVLAEQEIDAALTAFKDKYVPFFVEDYRWTVHNYDGMAQNA
jgi:hypothetical protein